MLSSDTWARRPPQSAPEVEGPSSEPKPVGGSDGNDRGNAGARRCVSQLQGPRKTVQRARRRIATQCYLVHHQPKGLRQMSPVVQGRRDDSPSRIPPTRILRIPWRAPGPLRMKETSSAVTATSTAVSCDEAVSTLASDPPPRVAKGWIAPGASLPSAPSRAEESLSSVSKDDGSAGAARLDLATAR